MSPMSKQMSEDKCEGCEHKISGASKTTSNMNNGMIVIDGMTRACKDGRRIGDPAVQEHDDDVLSWFKGVA